MYIYLEPKLVQSSISLTSHSESDELVPAEFSQLVFPLVTEAFLTRVWSFVAPETPATFHPAGPGSELSTPMTSKITVKLPEESFPNIPIASFPL